MPDFWSLIGNEQYDVGCTGRTVYLYDKNGDEIAKFNDLPYAYTAAISPRGDIFVVKTTEGRMAVYSFEPPMLMKKFRFSKVDGAQDDSFCFSPDGTEFYNIERHHDSCKTALSIYDTKDFSLKRRILNEDFSTVISEIEYCADTDEIYLLGFFRNQYGVAEKYFASKLKNDLLMDLVQISNEEYMFFRAVLGLRMRGYTKKAYEWSYIDIELEKLKISEHSLARLWHRETAKCLS